MNKTYLCVLPLTLVLAAYSGDSIAQEIECEKAPVVEEKDCKGDPQAPMVTLNLNTMTVAPSCVRAKLGANIVFRLTPKNDLKRDTVEIFSKDSFDEWLQGKNDTFDDIITIRVPGVHDPESGREHTLHDYSVKAPGKCLDPRVRVED